MNIPEKGQGWHNVSDVSGLKECNRCHVVDFAAEMCWLFIPANPRQLRSSAARLCKAPARMSWQKLHKRSWKAATLEKKKEGVNQVILTHPANKLACGLLCHSRLKSWTPNSGQRAEHGRTVALRLGNCFPNDTLPSLVLHCGSLSLSLSFSLCLSFSLSPQLGSTWELTTHRVRGLASTCHNELIHKAPSPETFTRMLLLGIARPPAPGLATITTSLRAAMLPWPVGTWGKKQKESCKFCAACHHQSFASGIKQCRTARQLRFPATVMIATAEQR